MTDLLPILTTTAVRHAATKTWRRTAEGWHKVSFDAGQYFTHREREVGDIHTLARELEQVSTDPRSFVIRGAIKDDKRSEKEVRRRMEKGREGDAFVSASRCWVMLDFDKIPLPPGYDLHAPEDGIEWLIGEHLPEIFHDTTTWWQLSASAGVEDQTTISIHLWFWLDRPISDAELKAYFKIHAPVVDVPLFNAVQMHYTARPIFEGVPDPISVRQGLMVRENEAVTLPDIDVAELATRFVETQKSAGVVVGGNFEARLAQMGDGPGRLGFHVPIRDAIMAYVREQKVGLPNMRVLKTRIREGIHTAPKRPGRNVDTYLSDTYIDSSIQGAIARKNTLLIDTSAREAAEDTYPLAVGETRLEGAIEGFFDGVADFAPDLNDNPPPIHAIAGELGLGKTEVALRHIAERVNLSHERIHYYVPTHKLTADVRDRFNAMLKNGEARIWKGRSRVEDGTSETDLDGNPMCFDDVREKADIYERAGISVSEHFCPTCPHFKTCGWSRQMEDKGPGLVLMPVNYAFESTAKRANIQIFDETFWPASMRDATVSFGALSIPEIVPGRTGGSDIEASADLAAAREKLKTAFKDAPPSIPQLRDAGITGEVARRVKAIEHQRGDAIMKVFKPSMTVSALERTWNGFQHRDARRWGRVWSMIEDQIDLERDRLHGFRRYTKVDDDGDPKDLLAICWSQDLHARDIPTLVLDATLDEVIIRRFLPDLEKVERIRVEAPHAHVTQITDRVVSKSMMIENEKKKERPEELQRKRNRVRDLGRFMETHKGEKVGLFTYQATETDLIERELLPDNILTAHFNNFRGLDLWKDADTIVLAGRPLPSEREVEKIAEGLFYKSETEIGPPAKYGKTLRPIEGQNIRIETVAHPDPLVEAVRYQICEAELIQGIGRGRPIRRTEDNPVKIFILTSVVLPIAVDKLTTWDNLVPDRWSMMTVRGVVFESGTHAAKAYPDLFTSAKAFFGGLARRANRAPSPYIDSPIGKRGSVRVRYQIAGAKQKIRALAYDPAITPNIQAWLEERLDVEIVRLVEEVSTGDPNLARPSGYEPDVRPSHAVATMATAIRIQEVEVAPPLEDEDGGLLSDEVAGAARALMRDANLTQDELAGMIGISRSQLTNALQSRYGLSAEPYAALLRFISNPPPIRQMSFSLK